MNQYSLTVQGTRPLEFDHSWSVKYKTCFVNRLKKKKRNQLHLPPWCCSFVKLTEENINDFDVSFILSLSIFHKKRISTGFQYCIYQPIRICTHSLPFLLLQCIMYLCSCLWPVPSFMLRILFPLSYSRPSNLSPTTVIPLLLF